MKPFAFAQSCWLGTGSAILSDARTEEKSSNHRRLVSSPSSVGWRKVATHIRMVRYSVGSRARRAPVIKQTPCHLIPRSRVPPLVRWMTGRGSDSRGGPSATTQHSAFLGGCFFVVVLVLLWGLSHNVIKTCAKSARVTIFGHLRNLIL